VLFRLKPHERTLRWVVLLMQATGLVLYMLVCTHTRLRLSPRGLARQARMLRLEPNPMSRFAAYTRPAVS